MTDQGPATLRRIADECGVSMTTVSKILRGKYKGNTRKGKASVDRVTELARQVGYMANGSARRLRGGRHRAIAVLAPVNLQGHPPFVTVEYITGIAMVLSAAKFSVSLHTYPREQPEAAAGCITDRNVDGAVFLEDSTEEADRFFATAGIPTVHINTIEAPGRLVLGRDETAAARAITETIGRLGYQRVLAVGGGGPMAHFSHERRSAGIQAGAAATRMAVDVCDTPSWHSDFEASLLACHPQRDSVVLAMDAATALRCMRCLPPDQPLACCDDTQFFHDIAWWLTRARFDRALLGRCAADWLLRRLDDPSAVLDTAPLPASVIVGRSTPPLAGR